MKKKLHLSIWALAASIIFSAGVLAQEKTEVSVLIKKDGKIVKDTTYQFEDASEAKHALKMLELLSGDDIHKAHFEGNHSKTMVFISEDGEKTELKEFHGDGMEWIEKEEGEGEQRKVMKYRVSEGDHPHGQNVVVVQSEDGSTFDILVDEDSEGNIVKKKEIKVTVSGDEDASWTVVDGDEKILDKHENVFVIKEGDDVKTEIIKIMKEEDGKKDSNVKVIVITNSSDKDHDCDKDHDKDVDHEEEVEVKVVKKKQKKENK